MRGGEPHNSVTPMGHNGVMAQRLLTPSKITAWLDCAHFLTLRHEVDSGVREPAPNMFGEMAEMLLQKGLDHEKAVLEQYWIDGSPVKRAKRRTTKQSEQRMNSGNE
jgi:hypothetical protein